MDTMKKWQKHREQMKNHINVPEREWTGAEIQLLGTLVKGGTEFPDRQKAKEKWLDWIMKPEQKIQREWNIEQGYITPEGKPLFE